MTTTDKLKDPNLSEAEEDAIIGSFVRQYENEQLRKQWEEKLARDHNVVREESLPPKRKARIRRLTIGIIAVAASLLLLLVFLPTMQGQNGEELLAEYVSEITIETSRSVTNEDADILRRELAEAFHDQRFADAITTGLQLVDLPDVNDEDRLHLSLAQLRAADYPAANAGFRQLLATESLYTAEARYYLGLSLLRSGDIPAGLSTLRELKPTDGRALYEQAQTLLEKDWD